MFNVMLTLGLLVLGAVNIFSNIGDFYAPAPMINAILAQVHQAQSSFPSVAYTPTQLTATVGAILLTLQGANFGLIVWWALKRLRERKLAIWVPVLGSVFSTALTMIAMFSLMLADPTVRAAILSIGN